MNDTFYKPLKEKIQSDFNKNVLRETDSRIIVDRKLREAGWDIEDKNQVTTEESIKGGRADYLLLDKRNRPLAVVETKKQLIQNKILKHLQKIKEKWNKYNLIKKSNE